MRRLGIVKHSSQLVLKFFDSLGISWEHHIDVLKNSEKIHLMDINSLFGNLQSEEEIKALRKDIMSDSNKLKFVAMFSRKEVASLISNSDDYAQGEINNDEIPNYLVSNVALIVKRYEKSRSNGARRVRPKGNN